MEKSLQIAINPVSTFGMVFVWSDRSGFLYQEPAGILYLVLWVERRYNNNIKQKIFPMKSEKVLIIADGAAFGPQMNDIYAYDPDTEEEAGQCVDEVIQIAEESGAEIQFY